MKQFRNLDYDVIWVGEWDIDPRDIGILEFAYQEQRVFVTLDKDFGELAVLHKKPHCGIIRLVDVYSVDQVFLCHDILTNYFFELQEQAIVTASPDRVRIRLYKE